MSTLGQPRTWRRLGREDGYNLVILTIMFTVMGIGLSAMLPSWKSQIQREKEAELIFRGLQYAEAIRIFQIRHGRPPVRLEELLEVEPRSIRQLWTNPMREDGRWALILQGTRPLRSITPETNQRGNDEDGNGLPNSGNPDDPDAGIILSGGDDDDFSGETAVGPIRGVYHPGDEEAFKSFFDSTSVADWKFTFDLFQMPGGNPQGNNPQGGNPQGSANFGAAGLPQNMPLNAGIIGKPFPPGIQPPNQGAPGGGVPGQGLPQQGRPIGTPEGSAGGPGGAAVQGLSEQGGGSR